MGFIFRKVTIVREREREEKMEILKESEGGGRPRQGLFEQWKLETAMHDKNKSSRKTWKCTEPNFGQ